MSQRTQETTEEQAEEISPSTIHGRHAEDDRDRKLQKLTATVEKLAKVIENMSKKQMKTDPVELKPKHRSRTPRRRRRDSRSNSRTPRRGRRRSKSRHLLGNGG